MNFFLRKTSLTVLIVVLSFSGVRTAQASFDGVLASINSVFISASTAIVAAVAPFSSVSGASTAVSNGAKLAWDTIGKPSLDATAYGLGQMALDHLTSNTVKWIQGGFKGSPNYDIDRDQLEKDTIEMITTVISNEFEKSAVCAFDPSFKINLITNIASNPATLPQKIKCPFVKGLLTDGGEAFYKDFRQGGWIGFESSLRDEGNPFGVSMIVSTEISKREQKVSGEQDRKAVLSKGFKDIVDKGNCNYPTGVKDALSEPKNMAPGSLRQEALDAQSYLTGLKIDLQNYETLTGGALADSTTWVRRNDIKNTISTAERDLTVVMDAINDPANQNTPNPNYIQPEQRKIYERTHCAIASPGNLLSEQLIGSFASERARLMLSDSFTKIFSAAIGQLQKQATEGIFKGLASLKKNTPANTPAYTAPNVAFLLVGILEDQQVKQNESQVDGARKRWEAAAEKVTGINDSISTLEDAMSAVTCSSTPSARLSDGRTCNEADRDLTQLKRDLSSALTTLQDAAAALTDLERILNMSQEKADRAKAVKLTAVAHNILSVTDSTGNYLLTRKSNTEETDAANTAEKYENPLSDTTRDAIALVRSAPATSGILAANNAKKDSSIYQAEVIAVDAILAEKQKTQFDASELNKKFRKILTDASEAYHKANNQFFANASGVSSRIGTETDCSWYDLDCWGTYTRYTTSIAYDWTDNHKVQGPAAFAALSTLINTYTSCGMLSTLASLNIPLLHKNYAGVSLGASHLGESATPLTTEEDIVSKYQRAGFGWGTTERDGIHSHFIYKEGGIVPALKFPTTCEQTAVSYSVAFSAVSVARINSDAVRGINENRTCASPYSSESGKCEGLDNVATWIEDATKIIEDAKALADARALVLEIAKNASDTFE